MITRSVLGAVLLIGGACLGTGCSATGASGPESIVIAGPPREVASSSASTSVGVADDSGLPPFVAPPPVKVEPRTPAEAQVLAEREGGVNWLEFYEPPVQNPWVGKGQRSLTPGVGGTTLAQDSMLAPRSVWWGVGTRSAGASVGPGGQTFGIDRQSRGAYGVGNTGGDAAVIGYSEATSVVGRAGGKRR